MATIPAQRLLTEIEILKSDSLMLTVAARWTSRTMRIFSKRRRLFRARRWTMRYTRQDTVHRLQSNLHITLVPKTDIIRISYSSLNPKLSADIVNKVICGLHSAQLSDAV